MPEQSLASANFMPPVDIFEDDHTITLQTMTELLTIERGEIESIQNSMLSMMPEGLLDALNPTQVRDLIAYLTSPKQVPLPEVTTVVLPQ